MPLIIITIFFADAMVGDVFLNCGNVTKKQIVKMVKMKLNARKNCQKLVVPMNFPATMEIAFW